MLVAGDSTGSGAIPTPTSKLWETASPQEQVPAGTLQLRTWWGQSRAMV